MKRLLLAIWLAATLALAGLALADEATARPHITIEASTIEQVLIGLVRAGLRINELYSGTVTSVLLEGATAEFINCILFRPDGVIVVDGRTVFFIPDGPASAATFAGYAELPGPLELEAFLDPTFEPHGRDAVHMCRLSPPRERERTARSRAQRLTCAASG